MALTRRGLLTGFAGALAAAPADELCFKSAVDLAGLIRTKQLSARELLTAQLKQIERVNPKVNAIVTLVPDRAMAAAAAADEKQAKGGTLPVLHGLPIAHKDLLYTKGIRTVQGSPLFKDFVPDTDDILVERLREAGTILLGKTNTPEFGAGSQTFNPVFGATRNPYDLTKTCGGSSGGAAVALATGMLPIADGSDTGGSLRNPAAFCNVVGFRTSAGRVPQLTFSTLSTAGPMARSVADVAFLLSAMAGPHLSAPLTQSEPGSVFRRPLGRTFKGVRVAMFKDLGGVPFDRRVRAVIEGQRKTLENLGCIVEQAEPDFAGADFAFKVLRAQRTAYTHGERMKTQRAAYKDTIVGEVEYGLSLTSGDISRAQDLHAQIWRRFQAFLTRYEYFVLPVTQVPPFDVTMPYPKEVDGVRLESYIDWMKSCWYITMTGNPAISVPAGFTPEGLPVGLQIVGRHQQDFAVLQLAHAFEQASPQRRRPSL